MDLQHQRTPFRRKLKTNRNIDIKQIIQDVGKLAGRSTVPRAQLDRFLSCADERAVLELVKATWRANWPSEVNTYIYEKAFERALRDADEAEIVWTPLLDGLEKMGVGTRRSRWTTTIVTQKSEERIQALVPWIEAQQDPKTLKPLLDFHFRPIRWLVAQHARALNAEFIGYILERAPHAVDKLAQNPAMTEEWLKELARWAWIALISKTQESHQIIETSIWPPNAHLDPSHALKALRVLREKSVLDPDFFDFAVTSLRPIEYTYRQVSDEIRREAGQNAVAFLTENAVLANNEEYLLKIHEAIWPDNGMVATLIEKTKSKNRLSLWRHIARRASKNTSVRLMLANIPEARRDPIVRRMLLRSKSISVLMELLKEASGDEFRVVFRKICKASLPEVLEILKNPNDDRIRLLRVRDLKYLLANFKKHTRSSLPLFLLLALRKHQLADVSGEEIAKAHFRTVFVDIYKQASAKTIEVLENPDEIRGLLSPADLLPILNSNHSKQRMIAIRAIAALEPTRSEIERPDSTKHGKHQGLA